MASSANQDLALNRPAVASSVQSSSYPASAAVDGDLNTRWSSQFSDPQWIYVDLGAPYQISEVVLHWETAYGKAFKVQVSNDASSWTTIYSTTSATGGTNDITGLSGTGRYVRIYEAQRGTQWGYSLWELDVFGTPTDSNSRTGAHMAVGLGTWNWGSSVAAKVAGSVGWIRSTSAAGSPTAYTSQGIKAIITFGGTCPTCGASANGVSSINPASWASQSLSWYQSNCTPSTCPAIELLNEPGGPWFWGSNALAQGNATTYAQIIVDTYNDFLNYYGASRPLIIASYDGGWSGGSVWGREVYAANPNIGNYLDGWTVHPYGGTSNATLSAQGNRANVENAHSATGEPIYVTEVGWPTDCANGCPTTTNATSDSLQWSETEQAQNIYNFVKWARSTNYVAAVTIYQYLDDGGNGLYGVTRSDGSEKPGWTALSEAAHFQTCTVC